MKNAVKQDSTSFFQKTQINKKLSVKKVSYEQLKETLQSYCFVCVWLLRPKS